MHDRRTLNIVTPEHIRLQFQTAGIGSRGIAVLIDSLIIGLLDAVFALLIFWGGGVSGNLQFTSYMKAVLIVLVFVVNFGYFIILEYYWSGKTVGKRVMHLRVMQHNGQSLTFLSSAVRNFFRIVDMLPFNYFAGAVIMFFNGRDKRLGDFAAGTVVVWEIEADKRRTKRKIDKFIQKHAVADAKPDLSGLPVNRLDYDDWMLIEAFMERLPNLPKNGGSPIAVYLVEHLEQKLGEGQLAEKGKEAAFLIRLYAGMREEWL